ncbi:MAG: hypothetical protein Q9187_003250 [Circinaria calcarea]
MSSGPLSSKKLDSDLHLLRGYEACPAGTTMGHEFYGAVVEKGNEVESLEVGDLVVSPFTVSCGVCFYCQTNLSSRCVECLVFGTQQLPGAQAEYVRVPHADTTVFKAPESLDAKSLVLMADVFPTGYFAATSAFSLLPPSLPPTSTTAVVIGCGPVGLCAITTASTYPPQHFFAIDSVLSRLSQAQALGAIPLDISAGLDNVAQQIRQATQGRGADVVMELVGRKEALRTGFDLLRPGGVLVSAGVHSEGVPWTLAEAYAKNLRLQMGRCPVRSIFAEALRLFMQKQHLLGFMTEHVMPLSDAVEGYAAFERREVVKVILDAGK